MLSFTLSANENVLVILRRHKFVLGIRLLKAAGVALLPFVILIFLLAVPAMSSEPAYGLIFWYFASLFWLVAWCWGFLIWLDWYLDIWVLTNERVISIEQRRLFNRQVLSCNLDKVQSVTTTAAGALPTFFHYGNVEIKTADETSKIIFTQIPLPLQIQDKILQAHQDFLKNTKSANLRG